MLFNHSVKPAHDRGVLSQRRSILIDFAIVEAVDHRFDQRLFETTRRLGMRENRWGILRKMSGGLMQSL